MMENNTTIETEQISDTAIQTPPAQRSEKLSTPNIWSDSKALASAYKAAQYLAGADLVPEQTYKNKPQNCLIALEIANSMQLPVLQVMNNLFIVRGKPGWSGQFCMAAINGCGRFISTEYMRSDEKGGSCWVRAVRKSDGKVIDGAKVSMQMANDEGWLSKNGSKWKTMPELMLQYRAAAFFARAYCPDILLGLQTADELHDTYGYSEPEEKTVTLSLTSPDT